MKTKFLFQGMEPDDEAKQYVMKRLSAVEKLTGESTRVEVEIDRDKKGLFRVEIMMHEPGNRLFRAEETSESVEGSTDMAIDEVKRQLVEKRDRADVLVRRGARSIKKRLTLDDDARF